jgi:2-oxoglutarate ferredoxin oxidoreductase subunit alpha
MLTELNTTNPGSYFWQGNVACVEGALAAGCKFFAGYPITPANEISEWMSRRIPSFGGVFIQMEDEIASMGAIIGASWGGAKSMTATSGPGFSLMQENIGLAIMTETPCVVVDVQRVGPSTGQATKCAQGDIMQARWGTHGDHEIIALAPNSVQEMFTLTVKAFNLAERYRTPVILLADEIVSHLRERIDVPEKVEVVERQEILQPPFFSSGFDIPKGMPPLGRGLGVSITGSTHDPAGIRATTSPEIHRKLVEGLTFKIQRDKSQLADCEMIGVEGCDIGVISFGCTSRAVEDAIEIVAQRGIRVGHLRLRTIWPFPEEKVRELAEQTNRILVPEMNLGQLSLEVERIVSDGTKVLPLNKIGGGLIFTPSEIASAILRSMER